MEASRVARLEQFALGSAILVRVWGLLAIGRTAWVDQPLVDAYTYWDQATQILAGKDAFADGYYQAPGYPWFLVGLAKLTGGLDFQTTRAVQLGFGVLTTWLLLRLGRRIGGQAAPWLGAAAALVYGLYPTALMFELDLLTPALTNVLLVGAISVAWGATGQTRGQLMGLAAGLLLGLATAVHPTFALALLAMAAVMLPQWRVAAAVLVGGALVIGPLTMENARKSGAYALISHNSGLNFYLGNNPNWTETAFLRPGLPFRELVLEAEPDKRGRAELDAWWWDRAWTEIGQDPVRWTSALGTKALWSVNHTEIPRNEDYRCRLDAPPLAWMGLLPVRYGLVFPFAVVGAALLARRREGARLVPALWLGLAAPMVIFLVADRYRVSTWPLLALAAPVGALALVEAVKARRAPVLVAAGVLAVLPWLPINPVTAKNEGWCAHVEGNLAYGDKDYAAAEERYQRAVDLDPGDLDAWRWLAYAQHELGRDKEAIASLGKAIDGFPDYYPTLLFMSQLLERTGDISGAADMAGRAYRVPGNRTNTGVRYIKLLVRAGRTPEAAAVAMADDKLARHKDVRAALVGGVTGADASEGDAGEEP